MPYFILAFINLLLNAIYESQTLAGMDLLVSTGKHAFWIFYSLRRITKMPNCTPLWFLPCLFICHIYMHFLIKISSRYKRYLICFGLLCIEILLKVIGMKQFPWHLDTALCGTLLMWIGMEIRNHNLLLNKEIIKKKHVALLTIVGVCIALSNGLVDMNSGSYGHEALFLMGAVSLSLVVMWLSARCTIHLSILEKIRL